MMTYDIIIGGETFFGVKENRDELYNESSVLSGYLDHDGYELMPVTKNFTGLSSGVDVREYKVPEYEWIPFPYLSLSRAPEDNVYEMVKNGIITKENVHNTFILRVNEQEYVSKYFDLYQKYADKVLGISTEDGVETAVPPQPEDNESDLLELDNMFDAISSYSGEIDSEEKAKAIELILKAKDKLDKAYSMVESIPVTGQEEKPVSTEEPTDDASEAEPSHIDSESQDHQDNESASNPTPEKPATLTTGSAASRNRRTTKTGHVFNNILGGSDPRFQDSAVRSGFTADGDGGVEVDLSKVVNVPEVETAVPPQPEGYAPQQPLTVNPHPPVVSNPSQVTPPEPKQRPGKNDIVSTPQPTVVPGVDPVAVPQVEEDNADPLFDDFVKGLPILSLYRKALPAEYSIKAMYDDHYILRLKAIKADTDEVVDGLSITFDNDGIFTKTPKFWPGVDPDTTFDFERPLIFKEEVLAAYMSAYLNGKPLEECLTEDMYLVNQAIVDLNESIAIRSIWDTVDGGNNPDTMTEVMKNIKLSLEKDKKFKKMLGKNRMILTSFTDVNNFVMETPKSVPSSYNGQPINTAHVVYSYNNGKITTTKK